MADSSSGGPEASCLSVESAGMLGVSDIEGLPRMPFDVTPRYLDAHITSV